MNRSARPILVVWLVVLHAGLTVCASSLHALPGLGHGTGLNRSDRDDHSHGPGKSSQEAADDCAVCHFLAQGQLATSPSAGPPAWLIALADPHVAHISAPIAQHRASSPRAPPRRCASPTPA
jgi:hypothetical protein